MIMKYKICVPILLTTLLIACSGNTDQEEQPLISKDSIKVAIEDKVNAIIAMSDSMQMVPSLRYAKGETETYTAKMFGMNQTTKRIREEHFSNEIIVGRDYYFDNDQLIFIKEEGSRFEDATEVYTEKLIYIHSGNIYKAFEKHQYTEDNMFDDTLFQSADIDLSSFDLEKPMRAIEQREEFSMYFDEFLLLDPQTYLIVENKDKTINAALYIIEGDSLLSEMYANPSEYEGKKLWVYHSFREMSGIERMIYHGAVLVDSPSTESTVQ